MTTAFVILVAAASTVATPSHPAFGNDPLFDAQMEKRIEISEVPQAARDAAARELSFAELKDALLRDDGGQLVYEFDVQDSVGATHVAWFEANGTPVVLSPDDE